MTVNIAGIVWRQVARMWEKCEYKHVRNAERGIGMRIASGGIGEVGMTSLVLRGALVMQDGQSAFRPDPCDVLI